VRLASLKRIAEKAVKFGRLVGAVHLVQRDNFCHVDLCACGSLWLWAFLLRIYVLYGTGTPAYELPGDETGWSRRETGFSSLSLQHFSENMTFCRNVERNHSVKKSIQWQRLLKISVCLQASNRRRSLRQATRLASEGLSWMFCWFNLVKVTLRNTVFDIQIFYIVSIWNLCVLYGSQNKQQILPYATLKVWFLWSKWGVFTARCALSPYITQIRFVFKGLKMDLAKSSFTLPVLSSTFHTTNIVACCWWSLTNNCSTNEAPLPSVW